MTTENQTTETQQEAPTTQAEAPTTQTEAFEGAPHITQRKNMRPFGADLAHELMVKREAIRTLPRQVAFDRGYLTVKDLDDEELRYGRCRDERGHIPKNGKKTELIPQDKFDEMIAEHETRFKQKLRQNLDDMLEIAIEIAKDDTVEPRDRFEAAKYLMERVVGKTPETVNVTIQAKPWEELLKGVTGIAPMSRAQHRELQGAGIVDAEYEEISNQQEAYLPNSPNPGPGDATTGPQAQNAVQPQDVPPGSQGAPEQTVVPVHKARPVQYTGDEPDKTSQEPYLEYAPDPPDHTAKVDNQRPPTPEPPPEDPSLDYGRRADQKRTYAEQARDAQDLARRRRDHKDRIQSAKKRRKIDRALGADAIEDEITGATIAPDGQVHFE